MSLEHSFFGAWFFLYLDCHLIQPRWALVACLHYLFTRSFPFISQILPYHPYHSDKLQALSDYPSTQPFSPPLAPLLHLIQPRWLELFFWPQPFAATSLWSQSAQTSNKCLSGLRIPHFSLTYQCNTKDLGNLRKCMHQSLVQGPWYKDLVWGVSIPVTQPIQLSEHYIHSVTLTLH